MPVTFIGDVHGQLAALEELLPQCQGHIIFVGDLIDRGPHSREVVRRVRELCDAGQASCILGNHEFALVSSVGLPEHGVPSKPHFFSAWCQVYGGFQTLVSYGFTQIDLEHVRSEMREDLEWMYKLPWYIRGEVEDRAYLVIHAGLNDRDSLSNQLAGIDNRDAWWQSTDQLPPAIYEHARAHQNPPDLDPELCVVSGHSVQDSVLVEANRLLCDTSGGRPNRRLSGVIWPQGTVISAATAG